MAKELRIRNFPPELLKALRIEAARRGATLRELVIENLKPVFRVTRISRKGTVLGIKPVYGPYDENDKPTIPDGSSGYLVTPTFKRSVREGK